MDAVYLYGPGGDDELRHSLRSLSGLLQVDRVAVAGHHPDWLSDQVLRVDAVRHGPGKNRDTWANLLGACRDRRLSDEIVLMNDDFFVVGEVPAIPVWHAGVLSTCRPRTTFQDKRLTSTLSMLDRLGAPGRLSYEMHIPMVMHRHLMKGLMRQVEQAGKGSFDPPVWKRTLYGNFAHPGVGELRDDVKVREFDAVPRRGQRFVSTSDYTWRRGAVGVWIRQRFAEPCQYERG